MIAEIGLLNKHAVALAADSAVTIGGGTGYYNTANKIFALSKYEPVAIMIYSNAEIMGIPVEIIIKEYKKQLGKRKFNTLEEYKLNFLEYLEDFLNKKIKCDSKYYHLEYINNIFRIIHNNVINIIERQQPNVNSIPDIIQNLILEQSEVILNELDDLENDPLFNDFSEKIYKDIERDVDSLARSIFGEDIYEETLENLLNISVKLLVKKHDLGNYTGIVITGYGREDIFPKLTSVNVIGAFFEKLKFKINKDICIDMESNASIIPFAQSDVVNTFVNGYDYELFNNILKTIDLNLSDSNDLIEKIVKSIQGLSKSNHWGPMLHTVSVAPKEELAHMAETLVNLTSFRRKLSLDRNTQTVGGPIDVVLITKGDGLIWIKRKLYFDGKLNHSFYENYYKEDLEDESIKV